MGKNMECIWVVGKTPESENFCKEIAGMAGVDPKSITCLDELTSENLRKLPASVTPVFFFFPSSGDTAWISWFVALARLESYTLYVDCGLSGLDYWRTSSEEVAGRLFHVFSFRRMRWWARGIKRGVDIIVSVLCLILLSPLFLFCMIKVRKSSPGPIWYTQERVGKDFREFKILKFRSMYQNAENGAPALSNDGDRRITPWGNVMRRYRIDEIPQFWNVLKGDMSLIGYRPERSFFIRKIEEKAPYYHLLMAVRPGISSLGITRFGYAVNVEQMLVRLNSDMEYLSHVSLKEDMKVIGMTLEVVLKGLGK